PTHYRITLEPNLEEFTFRGSEIVDVEIYEALTEVTLHAAELVVTSAELVWPIGSTLIASAITYDQDTETVTLRFGEGIQPGCAKIQLAFTGTLNDKMQGFYRSSYTVNGEKRFMATTQFEATDARRAFPCWDEPALKARFSINLVVPNDNDALSNMPVSFVKSVGIKKEVRFMTSPVMSTYLVAFCVGEFESIERFTNRGVLVRVITTPGKKEWGRFALGVAVRTVELYEDYFGITYPLPKMDLVAIPDFAAGAMENWGLVTYRETALLFDPENSAAAAKQRVAIVVAHELAHQWFGNLVTMKWWTDLWLNEGFASWIEYFAVDRLFPEWDIWTQFAATSHAPAMSDDGLRNTHPVEVEVKHPNEISEIFDAISYEKGASVIRMIESYLGGKTFQDGLRLYLKRHAYANATTEDLWDALGEVSGKPVKAIMESWTKQSGFPVVTLEHIAGDAYVMRQVRFLSSGEALTSGEEAQVWKIPIPLGVQSEDANVPTSVLMSEKEMRVLLPLGKDGWMKLNVGQVVFLRVNYMTLWERLKPAITQGALSAVDRFGIANDLAALAKAGAVRTSQALSMLEAFKSETDFTVWNTLLGTIDAIDNLLIGNSGREEFTCFARELLRAVAEYVGWESVVGEPHTKAMLRAAVLRAFGGYGDRHTIQIAEHRFQQSLLEPMHPNYRMLDPNIRSAVYALVAENGREATFNLLVDLYRRAELQEEKVRLLRALGQFRDHGLLQKALEFAFSDDVRSQDAFSLFVNVAKNPRGRALAWEFMKSSWGLLRARYASGGLKLLSDFIEGGTERFTTEAKANEVEEFFIVNPAPNANRAIRQSVERIRMNAQWFERDRGDLTTWLQRWYAWSWK
ncbi:MAG: M1 family metallopeptidase, partial [Parcubacteria group bacterium]|nr:M1 family metallopeptidase [Parcubacteria group bacterium]